MASMINMTTWLIASGVGVLFGSVPAWFSCSAMVLDSVARDKKAVPSWLKIAAADDMYGSSSLAGIIPNRYYPTIFKTVAYAWAILFLAAFHYLVRKELSTGNLVQILSIESSSPLFFLVTWLLPAYFLRRYLRALPVLGVAATQRRVPKNELKLIASLFLALVVLLCILFVYTWLSQPIPWRAIVIEVIPLLILLHFAVLVTFRAWRKREDTVKHDRT